MIVARARDRAAPLGGRFTPNDLYARVSLHHDGHPPVSRGTFYTWFPADPEQGATKAPSQSMLECVPAFAAVLDIPEHELWQAAGVLPPSMTAPLAIASAAHEIRAAHRQVRKTLAESGLSTAGEALVVDRILHAQLDYRMEVWPVVRGERKQLHLHSWIVLTPIGAEHESTRRLRTQLLEAGDAGDRRRYIREKVISESLWRTLGLKWRDNVPEKYLGLGADPLFIEIPVEERNRPVPRTRMHDRLQVARVLVLGAPWAHAELMAALLADALAFGSTDLRYIGFQPEREAEEKERFCRERLAEGPARYVQAIGQRSDMMRRLRPDIVRSAPGQLVVVLTYGPAVAEFVASQAFVPHTELRKRRAYIADAGKLLDEMAVELSGLTDVVRVHIADGDVVSQTPGTGRPVIDRHRMSDAVRNLTAQVLNLVYDHKHGPGIPLWGDRFDDLRLGDDPHARIPLGDSTVEWMPRGARG